VCQWLERHGYRIVARNFRCRMGEIDIVAREAGYLVFIEVKYRSSPGSGTGEEAVNWRKQQTISRVALYYLRRMGYRQEVPVRFDVVAVSGEKELTIHLYQNAFDFCG
jgi:putative endonuclease